MLRLCVFVLVSKSTLFFLNFSWFNIFFNTTDPVIYFVRHIELSHGNNFTHTFQKSENEGGGLLRTEAHEIREIVALENEVTEGDERPEQDHGKSPETGWWENAEYVWNSEKERVGAWHGPQMGEPNVFRAVLRAVASFSYSIKML